MARARFLHPLDLEHLDSKLVRLGIIRCVRGNCGCLRLHGIVLVRCRHADVNVFEDLTRGDAQDSVIRLDEVVALAAAMLAAEMVDEGEAGAELLGFDEEPCAVSFPFRGFHGATRAFVLLLAAVLKRIAFQMDGPVGTARIFL